MKKIQSYGMEVMAGFIVGFDNDPEDIFERQIDFIRESAIPLAMVGLLTALPDTQLWRRLEREGRLLVESTGNNTDGSLNFVPKMDAARLVEGYKSIMRTIYSPGEYYQRALDCLERVVSGAPESQRNGIRQRRGDFPSHRAGARRARPRARRVLALLTPRPYPASREVRGCDEAGRDGLSLSQAD